MAKSGALSGAMTWSLVGARIFTVGSGAAGSGLAIPCVNVTGGAGGGAADDAAGGAGGGAGGGGGGGGGGGRLSFAPPQATAPAAHAIEIERSMGASGRPSQRAFFMSFMARENHPCRAFAQAAP